MSIKLTDPTFVDLGAASIEPNFLILELLDLYRRITRPSIMKQVNQDNAPLLLLLGCTDFKTQDAYYSNFLGLRYWAGVFSETELGLNKISSSSMTVTYRDVADMQSWIRRSVQALEDFIAAFPGENLRKVSWSEKVAIRGNFQCATLRVNSPDVGILNEVSHTKHLPKNNKAGNRLSQRRPGSCFNSMPHSNRVTVKSVSRIPVLKVATAVTTDAVEEVTPANENSARDISSSSISMNRMENITVKPTEDSWELVKSERGNEDADWTFV